MLFDPYEFLVLILSLALMRYCELSLRTNGPARAFHLTGLAVAFCMASESFVLANPAEVLPDKKTISPILDAIDQNTPGQSQGYPFGVPRNYAWYRGSHKPPGASSPPSDFTAVTGWGQVYPKAGAPEYTNPDGGIVVANAKTYVHLSGTCEWILIQDQSAHGIAGDHFVSDFKPKPAPPMKLSTQPDGSVAIGFPPVGYNNHFWIIDRGTYPAGSVDGVYVEMDMKINDASMKFVANVGADWWRDASSTFLRNFANNPGAGMSNWVELSTDWSTLRFYSWSTHRLLMNPPPPLAETAPTPRDVRPRATASPCSLPNRRADHPLIVPSLPGETGHAR